MRYVHKQDRGASGAAVTIELFVYRRAQLRRFKFGVTEVPGRRRGPFRTTLAESLLSREKKSKRIKLRRIESLILGLLMGLQKRCRREMLLEYFGEAFDPIRCRDGRSPCDNCRRVPDPNEWRTRNFDEEDEQGEDEDYDEERGADKSDDDF